MTEAREQAIEQVVDDLDLEQTVRLAMMDAGDRYREVARKVVAEVFGDGDGIHPVVLEGLGAYEQWQVTGVEDQPPQGPFISREIAEQAQSIQGGLIQRRLLLVTEWSDDEPVFEETR